MGATLRLNLHMPLCHRICVGGNVWSVCACINFDLYF